MTILNKLSSCYNKCLKVFLATDVVTVSHEFYLTSGFRVLTLLYITVKLLVVCHGVIVIAITPLSSIWSQCVVSERFNCIGVLGYISICFLF